MGWGGEPGLIISLETPMSVVRPNVLHIWVLGLVPGSRPDSVKGNAPKQIQKARTKTVIVCLDQHALTLQPPIVLSPP